MFEALSLFLYLIYYISKSCSSPPFFEKFSGVIYLYKSVLLCYSVQCFEFLCIVVIYFKNGYIFRNICNVGFYILIDSDTSWTPVCVKKKYYLSLRLSYCGRSVGEVDSSFCNCLWGITRSDIHRLCWLSWLFNFH